MLDAYIQFACYIHSVVTDIINKSLKSVKRNKLKEIAVLAMFFAVS